MYLKEIKFQNYGALKDVNYTFQFNHDGTPKPTVFIGKNGSGKTLVLSNIIHALIEMKRKFYDEISETSEQNFYRLGSKFYIHYEGKHTYTKITFDNDVNYTGLMTYNYAEFKEIYTSEDYPGIDMENKKLKDSGHFYHVGKPEENIFEKNVFSYFPVERYYIPTWENKKNDKLTFAINDSSYVGYDNDSMIKNNILQDIEAWILDILIDQHLYETKTITEIDSNGEQHIKSITKGKNTDVINTINNILSLIFVDKYKSVRFGVTPKIHGIRQIQIIGINDNDEEQIIVPKFSNLSSGEIMTFGMIASILKECDRFNNSTSTNIKEISGIVLIDEIDLHLHSDLLKHVLPNLIGMFPKIQFVLTSHSPFFLLGMKERLGEKCNFVTLPTGTITNQIERFDEIERCYSIIDDSYKEVLNSLEKVQNKLKTLSKPLIITEGKTDWKHIKHALSVFQAKGEFQNIDVDFQEYDAPFGESKLKTLLENLAIVSHPHKIIGVFDSDTKNGKKYDEVHKFSKDVYSCCIKDVQGYNCGISIELLYSRADLKLCDDNGRRIFLSDEFNEKTFRLKENPLISSNSHIITDAYKNQMIKVVGEGVFDEKNESLALSKNDFANCVYEPKGNFSNINVEGFRNILETIQSICDM